MIIREWDEDYLVVTDNFITNLPVSRLSSIPFDAGGLGPDDLMLVSKPCSPEEMTETGYMSYYAKLDDLSAWIQDALDITGITSDMAEMGRDVSALTPYLPMFQELSANKQSAIVETELDGKFDPLLISAIYVERGTILSALAGYRLDYAIDRLLQWKKLGGVSADSGDFGVLSAGGVSASSLGVSGAASAGMIVADEAQFASAAVNGALAADEIEAEDITADGISAVRGVFEGLSAEGISTASCFVSDLTAGSIQTDKLEFDGLSAATLQAGSAEIGRLSVDGLPLMHLSVATDEEYASAGSLRQDCFYFTYPS